MLVRAIKRAFDKPDEAGKSRPPDVTELQRQTRDPPWGRFAPKGFLLACARAAYAARPGAFHPSSRAVRQECMGREIC